MFSVHWQNLIFWKNIIYPFFNRLLYHSTTLISHVFFCMIKILFTMISSYKLNLYITLYRTHNCCDEKWMNSDMFKILKTGWLSQAKKIIMSLKETKSISLVFSACYRTRTYILIKKIRLAFYECNILVKAAITLEASYSRNNIQLL